MASLTSVKSAQPNRRRRVRHQIQTPAYASFPSESKGAMLDLHEVINISEDGVAIQCHTPLEVGKVLNLCLDLAECSDHIYTTGKVIWSHGSGRAGLLFSELRSVSLLRLREWLFLNAMAGAANAEEAVPSFRDQIPIRPSYTDTLAAVNAVQREVEALGSDLAAALKLVAARAQTLVHASGAAIALAGAEPEFMVCQASSGPDAPPVGARLQLGSGFSGECVSTGRLLRCDDTELDSRVDRESCRVLGIRSIVAVPVRTGTKSVGLLEVFSAEPGVFADKDSRVLQRLSETILAAVNRAARSENLPVLESAAPSIGSAPGGVLFPAPAKEGSTAEEKDSSGVSLPRSLLILLIGVAAVIATVLGYSLAPWIQSDLGPWVRDKFHSHGSTHLESVLASSKAPGVAAGSGAVETASIDELLHMAEKGDPAAQNLLGLHYVNGDGVNADEREAVRWFTKAAEQGNIPSQSKLGSLYFRGRSIPQNLNQAYFWMVLARANGDENSRVLAPLVAARLTHAQATSIELDANRWLQQHRTNTKPSPGR